MTDAEIKKALKCCIGFANCKELQCPLIEECKKDIDVSYKYALDLINRQEERIERLSNYLKGCKGCVNIGLRYPFASMYPCNNCIRANRKDYYESKEMEGELNGTQPEASD